MLKIDYVCNTGAVEVEQHLLFNCSAYHSIPYRFMEKVQKSRKNFSNSSQNSELICRMNNESDDIINLFSIYIYVY